MPEDLEELFDVDDGGAAKAAPDRLKLLQQLVREQIDQLQLVEQIEEDLKSAKSVLHDLRIKKIPELMLELSITSITVDEKVVTVKDEVSGSLPKEDLAKRAAAIAYLETHEDGKGLIKNVLSIPFAPSQHNMALDLLGKLKEQGYDMAELKSDVHPQSLAALGRRMLESGGELDFEKVGLYHSKVAEIKKPRKKAGKR